nr:hypothetical protein [Alphaproteobacteria bacterium]
VLGKKNLIYDISSQINNVDNNIFSKIYYDMPEDVLKAKLKYVYEHSETPEQTVDALNMVQAFDKGVAELFIKDLSDEIVVRIKRSGDLADRMKNWDRLNKLEREAVNDELHEIVTTLRRNHVGNTIVSHETNMPGILGSHRQPTPTTPRKFEYVDLDENMEVVLTTIVHENTHAFQSLKKSTLHPYLYDWAEKVYTNDGKSRLYWDAISEQEARYVGENVTKRVVSMLGL